MNLDQQTLFLIIAVVMVVAFMGWQQWQTRKRREKQMSGLEIGHDVITIGGIIGKLTYLNAEENRARIEIAPGIEMKILPAAISRAFPPEAAEQA